MPIAQARIGANESIVTIASRLMGDGTRFRELVELNNLKPPYISDDGLNNTLKKGDLIRYPTNAQVASSNSNLDLEALTFKRGFKNPFDSTLALKEGAIERISGYPNLMQELAWRIRTPLGSHPAHPNTYGSTLYLHIGKVIDQARLELLKSDLRACILQDPRVEKVTVQDLTYSVGVLRCTLIIKPIGLGESFEYQFNERIT